MLKNKFVLMEEASGGSGEDHSGGGGGAMPWYQGVAGVDQEVVGHWTNKGWHTKTAPEVALEATKAWKAAEKFVGVPADQLLRMPKDAADEAAWNAVYSKLGKPVDSKGYDFSAIKFSDGAPLDDNFVNLMRDTAFKLHLPKDTATAITQEFAKFMDSAEATEITEKTAKLAEQKATLDKNWGANKDANLFIAKRAATALNVPPEAVSALEGVVGYDKVMDMFLAIGQKIGEDKFVSNLAPGGTGVMTRDQAVARRADLMTDETWRKAYLAGDKAKGREMLGLNAIISGDAEHLPKAA